MIEKKAKKVFIIILSTAFVISLIYCFYFKIQPAVDAKAYHNIAVNLVYGYGYIENPNLTPQTDLAVARPGPGYEFFLAVIYKIFGIHLEIVWLIQILLYLISGIFIYKISLKLFSDNRVAILSTFLYLFYIDVLQVPSMLLTENLFLFLIILDLFLLIKLRERNNLTNQLLFAIITAITILTRPTFILTIFLIFIYLILKKNYRPVIITAIIILIFLLPWVARNYKVYHQLMLSNATFGYNLWVGNNLNSNGEQQGTLETDSYLEKHGIIKTAEHGIQEYQKFVIQHPLKFMELQIVKTIKYFSLVRVSAFWFHLRGTMRIMVAIWSAIFAFIIFSFGALGFYQLIKEKKQRLLNLFIISFPLSVIPILVENRYRWPIYPFLAITAAYSFVKITKREIKWQRVLIFSLIFVIITVIDVIISYQDVISHLNNI